MNIFKKLGKVKYKGNAKIVDKIDINKILEGNNNFDEYIIYRKKNLIKVYNRICDHAGGKIITKNSKNICPVHNWDFNCATGFYSNGVKKKELKFIKDNKNILISRIDKKPEINKFSNKNNSTSVRFLNHAFLNIFGDNFNFSTDPWAIGPAFNTGWWLKYKTKNDWVEILNNSSFIYISHNHPDHLHPLTLSKINKNVPIVVPKFTNDSTGVFMEDLGFQNIIRLELEHQYNLKGTELIFSILKSGDFRNDSGIYFSNGNFTGLIDVDSNMINFGKFPLVDFYASSYAGGASGYPLMFDNYTEKEQNQILIKNKNFEKIKKIKILDKVKPKYFFPYAGFFAVELERDSQVKKNNQKNSISDYEHFCKRKKIKLLNVEKKDIYIFKGNKLKISKNINKKDFPDINPEKYLKYYKDEYDKIDYQYIKQYFVNSGFKENLHLYILLTDDNFNQSSVGFFVNFTKNKIIFSSIKKFNQSNILKNNKNKILLIEVRKESFLNTVYNKLPWDDLSIGFQCRIKRNPNIYNVDFWHHFSNVHVSSKNIRVSSKCNSCFKINEFFDLNIYQKKQVKIIR